MSDTQKRAATPRDLYVALAEIGMSSIDINTALFSLLLGEQGIEGADRAKLINECVETQRRLKKAMRSLLDLDYPT